MSITKKPKATLNNWSLQSDPPSARHRYMAPEVRPSRKFIHADNPTGDERYISTSHLAKVDGLVVQTRSGSVYKLGEPCPKYLDWLASEGIDFDPEHPVTVK